MLVVDTETRTDASQALMFGSYRFIKNGRCLEEGVFYPDDLFADELDILKQYVRTHEADVEPSKRDRRLKLIRKTEFLEKFHTAVYKGRVLCVGFNLPFDLSRVAADWKPARKGMAGGFSFILWQYIDKRGRLREDKFRPRLTIKHLDSKRAIIRFTSSREPDDVDVRIDDEEALSAERATFRGYFLDARTLAFALTDHGHSLESACAAFGVEGGKLQVEQHGVLNEEYIDYNRQDVRVTTELTLKMLQEYDRFDITLPVTEARSPASLGKAHLRAMGIRPILERQPGFPKDILGHAQSAYFGGRASVRLRKVAIPIVYTDFLSMYPTVNSLMDLWSFLIAREICVERDCEDEIVGFLGSLTADTFFDQSNWKRLTVFVKLVPNDDILPVRAKYSKVTNDWQIGINHLYAGDLPNDGVWYALADVAASVLLTGRVPKVVSAFRLTAKGKQSGLRAINLREAVAIDPSQRDFFQAVIEERKRSARRSDLPDAERERLNKALKVLANATSYGIFGEMNPDESNERQRVTCYGIDAEPFQRMVRHPETPGEYCFPPVAALITAAARLMLALLERSVKEIGGTYAMEDTDSMAIVATRLGGLIECAGGAYVLNGSAAVRALSWHQVQDISQRFKRLNPYDPGAVSGSILEIEDDNFLWQDGHALRDEQRQLYCYAISAKRYAMFIETDDNPDLLRGGYNNGEDQWSEHGLGHLMNPTDPKSEDRSWMGQAWLNMIRKALGQPAIVLRHVLRPAVGRFTISSRSLLAPLEGLNNEKPYTEQIKPFNFLISCYVKPFGWAPEIDPTRFHLLAPYETNPSRWLTNKWIDQYTGKQYRITTTRAAVRKIIKVRSYANVLSEYEYHPEPKAAAHDGRPCGRRTVGCLERRHVRIDAITFIGKESNLLEEVGENLVHDQSAAYISYEDPSRAEWFTKILPILRKMPLPELVRLSGLSRSQLQKIRSGKSMPHATNRVRLASVATGK